MLSTARPNGQGLVEYAFIILLVALVVFSVLLIFGPIVANVFSTVNSKFANF
jgi:Flp pilus assembly pilin Flp